MKHKKLSDIFFKIGIAIIAAGISSGIAVGIFTADGFNLVSAIVIWLLSLVTGTGFVTVSGSLSEVHEKNQDDEETLRMIIESIKNGGDDA